MRPRNGIGAPRVLLLEALDSVGGDAADARERAAWLERAGATVVPLAVSRDAVSERSNGTPVFQAGPALRDQLRAATTGSRFDRAVVASATAGGGALARLMPRDTPSYWWPTGLATASAADPLARLVDRLTGRRELPSMWEGSEALADQAADPLGGAANVNRDATRPCLPLWDGDVVVVPEGFAGPGGRAVLEAFADLADDRSGVDLVAWTDAPVEGESYARRLGIEGRVHHVGSPSRLAEWAWWKHSQVVILTGARPISRGLLLRALASGCPVLAVAHDREFASAASWLSRQGCARVVEAERRTVASALEAMLERGGEVDTQIARARSLSATRTRETLHLALARWLDLAPSAARSRAA